jgi:hypothetical protein
MDSMQRMLLIVLPVLAAICMGVLINLYTDRERDAPRKYLYLWAAFFIGVFAAAYVAYINDKSDASQHLGEAGAGDLGQVANAPPLPEEISNEVEVLPVAQGGLKFFPAESKGKYSSYGERINGNWALKEYYCPEVIRAKNLQKYFLWHVFEIKEGYLNIRSFTKTSSTESNEEILGVDERGLEVASGRQKYFYRVDENDRLNVKTEDGRSWAMGRCK